MHSYERLNKTPDSQTTVLLVCLQNQKQLIYAKRHCFCSIQIHTRENHARMPIRC